jgi:hypothetical protein
VVSNFAQTPPNGRHTLSKAYGEDDGTPMSITP